jgi:catechol 2,3-dioxygenase-like lactoylglutathione lyase family enzyme
MNSAKSDSTTDLAKPHGAVGETIMANHKTKTPRVMGVGHVALNARDPAALAEFYREVLGFQVVPTERSDLGETVFLGSHRAEVAGALALLADFFLADFFVEVRSLVDLSAFHKRLLGRGVTVKMALNHGVSL